MSAPRVSPCLGLERRTQSRDHRAEAAQHAGEHVVGGDSQPSVSDLRRRVPIAEVVRGARERSRIGTAYFDQVFVGGNDAHDAPVVGFETIAAAQDRPSLEKDTDLLAADDRGAEPALLPQLEREHQLGIVRRPSAEPASNDEHAIQNRKYRCAIGSTLAGSQTSSSPSARTS